MFKAMVLITRADHLTHDEFVRWWMEEHLPVARELPRVRAVTLNVVDEGYDDSGVDAVTELWFDSRADFEAAQGSAEGRAMATHAGQGMGRRVRLVVSEHDVGDLR